MALNFVNTTPSPLRTASLLAKSTSIEELYISLSQTILSTLPSILVTDFFSSSISGKQAFFHQTVIANNLQSDFVSDNIHLKTINEFENIILVLGKREYEEDSPMIYVFDENFELIEGFNSEKDQVKAAHYMGILQSLQ